MLIVYAASSGVSVVQLYAGALLPGLMLSGPYLAYILTRSILQPSVAPRPTPEEAPSMPVCKLAFMMLTSFFPLAFLILAVLCTILSALPTPTPAASVGALRGLLLAPAYRAPTLAV